MIDCQLPPHIIPLYRGLFMCIYIPSVLTTRRTRDRTQCSPEPPNLRAQSRRSPPSQTPSAFQPPQHSVACSHIHAVKVAQTSQATADYLWTCAPLPLRGMRSVCQHRQSFKVGPETTRNGRFVVLLRQPLSGCCQRGGCSRRCLCVGRYTGASRTSPLRCS